MLAAYLSALAISQRRFRLWPVAGLVSIASQLIVTYVWADSLGVTAVAAGYVLGATLSVVVLTPYIPVFSLGWLISRTAT